MNTAIITPIINPANQPLIEVIMRPTEYYLDISIDRAKTLKKHLLSKRFKDKSHSKALEELKKEIDQIQCALSE